jgi:predicted Rossmann fold flavoprotein
VPLKAEPDGRIFPASNRSQSILDCIRISAEAAGVILAPNCAVGQALRSGAGSFALKLADDRIVTCERLLLATGGSRTAAAGRLAVAFGHSLSPPVPSLFGFRLETPWLGDLAGISIEDVAVTAPDAGLEERGALLLTQGGVSGPAILCLSAWGARVFHSLSYRFPIRVNWLPHLSGQEIEEKLHLHRGDHPSRLVVNGPIPPLPGRLWERLVQVAGIQRETRWSALSRSAHTNLLEQLSRSELQVSGRSLNKEEFVTCGGVRLNEVDFKTMESRLCPGLYFAGEVLDIDGPTGGFNFQAAWTTGWLAGRAMARESR